MFVICLHEFLVGVLLVDSRLSCSTRNLFGIEVSHIARVIFDIVRTVNRKRVDRINNDLVLRGNVAQRNLTSRCPQCVFSRCRSVVRTRCLSSTIDRPNAKYQRWSRSTVAGPEPEGRNPRARRRQRSLFVGLSGWAVELRLETHRSERIGRRQSGVVSKQIGRRLTQTNLAANLLCPPVCQRNFLNWSTVWMSILPTMIERRAEQRSESHRVDQRYDVRSSQSWHLTCILPPRDSLVI